MIFNCSQNPSDGLLKPDRLRDFDGGREVAMWSKTGTRLPDEGREDGRPERRMGGLIPMLGLTQLSNYLTLKGSFSAVSKPNFASKYALESSRRDLQNALLCTVL